jgi:hypothetical protein
MAERRTQRLERYPHTLLAGHVELLWLIVLAATAQVPLLVTRR